MQAKVSACPNRREFGHPVGTGQRESDFVPPELLELVPPPVNGSASQNGSIGTNAHVDIDKRARLIPHAVDAVVVEHYRRLRTKILQQQATKPFRSLMVTSPNPQEGKTVTVLNLGFSF